MSKINILLNKYKIYILNDNINDAENFNFELLTPNITKFHKFLTLNYNQNNTYIYFKAIYHYCKKKI